MSDISLLLERVGDGDRADETKLFELVHKELHGLASGCMRRERAGHILQPTALVNEAYLRLRTSKTTGFVNRASFYSAAVRVMRQVLIDYARAACRAKRKSERVQLDLNEFEGFQDFDAGEVLAIDAALEHLRNISSRCARVVELRFFTGLDVDETAELLSVSPKTVKREWKFARAWLEKELRTDWNA